MIALRKTPVRCPRSREQRRKGRHKEERLNIAMREFLSTLPATPAAVAHPGIAGIVSMPFSQAA